MALSIRNLQFLDWRDINLTIGDGEVVCLLGESGSGKSLLLRAIADLIVSQGVIELEGAERSSVSSLEWRRKVGYLPAEMFWWEDSGRAHFLNPPSNQSLGSLRLSRDCLDWSPNRLSMGERQRLGILRMLDREPAYLLLDEPTANLDETNSSLAENRLLAYIRERGKGALWVSHSSEQAGRVGDRTLQMKDGAPRELMGEPGKAEA
ncbi:MAG: ATP-binding cassette domain-containing protein [Opitutales bacterium]|nr:ATP-binding cassette domain-containing protein [Opitutales bacterium]